MERTRNRLESSIPRAGRRDEVLFSAFVSKKAAKTGVRYMAKFGVLYRPRRRNISSRRDYCSCTPIERPRNRLETSILRAERRDEVRLSAFIPLNVAKIGVRLHSEN